MHVDIGYVYDGPVEKDGRSLEKITLKPKVSLQPDPDAKIEMKLKAQEGSGTALFDNSTGQWGVGSNGTNAWVQVVFWRKEQINEVTIKNANNTNRGPQGVSVQYYDGSTWQTDWTFTASWPTGAVTQTFTKP